MAKAQVDRYVQIIRRNDNNGGHYFRTVLYSENPNDNSKRRTHKMFSMDYETANRVQAELYAHKLAMHLECRVVE